MDTQPDDKQLTLTQRSQLAFAKLSNKLIKGSWVLTPSGPGMILDLYYPIKVPEGHDELKYRDYWYINLEGGYVADIMDDNGNWCKEITLKVQFTSYSWALFLLSEIQPWNGTQEYNPVKNPVKKKARSLNIKGYKMDANTNPLLNNKYLVREYYPFGYCPTYKDLDTGELLFVYTIHNPDSDTMTAHYVNETELKELLREYWQPVSQKDIAWMEKYVGKDTGK